MLPSLVFGQTNADSIRFEIIKKTVNFLAKDPKISKDVKFSVKCLFSDKGMQHNYSCLEISSKGSGIEGVLPKVKTWDVKKTGNKLPDLKQLKEKILQDISTPAAKAYRKKLSGYSKYVQSIDYLIKGYKDSSPKSKPKVKSKPETLKTVVSGTVDTAVTSSPVAAPAVKKDDSKQPAPDTTTHIVTSVKTQTMEESTKTVIALALSIIAVIISLFSLFKKGKQPEPTDNVTNQTPETALLKSKIKSLEEDLGKIKSKSAKDLELVRQSFENRITELENNKNTFELPVPPQVKPRYRPVETVDNAPVMTPSTIYKYAKFSDMDGGGFSAAILSDTQNGEQTYEILILGDQAEYGVSVDPRAQKYALHNYDYLTDACEIKGQPQTNSRIDTVTKGQLTRSPTGGWNIEARAVIELK